MDIDEEIAKLKERGPNKPIALPKMAKLLARMLDKAAVSWVGKVFWDKKFQRLTGFDGLPQIEKDRIFNELIVAPLALFMITMEAPDLNQPEDFRDYLKSVKEEIPKAHIASLKEMGVEEKYFSDWKKLIEMRYEEYAGDKVSAREAMMEFESKEKSLETSDLDGINIVLPVFTVAVGCHRHICRGKTKEKDELFKYLMKQLSRFYVEFRTAVEGAKITPVTRLKIRLRHFWNDLRDG